MKKLTNDWYTLDNTAKMYPMLVTPTNQNSFRLTFELKEPIDKEILAKSVSDILPRFPSFKVKLKEGFFWCYFEVNDKPINVTEDSGIILEHITNFSNNGYLFRIMYYNKNIIIEYYHILCDGKGSFEFGKSLVYQYLVNSGKTVYSEDKVITINSPCSIQELEDSFVTNYTNKRLKDLDVKSIKGEPAHRIVGSSTTRLSLGVIQGMLPLDKMLDLAKSYNCSLTIFVNALVLRSIYTSMGLKKKLKNPLVAFVPINLRNYYPSNTLRNFVMFSRVGIRKGDKTDTLEDFIEVIKRDLSHDLQREVVENKVNASVKLQKNFLVRILPLKLKYIAFKYIKQMVGSNKHTITVSNVGISDVPQSMMQYIDNCYFTLNTTPNLPVACGLNSYGNILNIVFSRQILETNIERTFFRTLSELGVEPTVTSNMWEM